MIAFFVIPLAGGAGAVMVARGVYTERTFPFLFLSVGTALGVFGLSRTEGAEAALLLFWFRVSLVPVGVIGPMVFITALSYAPSSYHCPFLSSLKKASPAFMAGGLLLAGLFVFTNLGVVATRPGHSGPQPIFYPPGLFSGLLFSVALSLVGEVILIRDTFFGRDKRNRLSRVSVPLTLSLLFFPLFSLVLFAVQKADYFNLYALGCMSSLGVLFSNLAHDILPASSIAQRDIFENFNDGLLVIDSEHRIRGWNRAYLELMGLSSKKRRGLRGTHVAVHLAENGTALSRATLRYLAKSLLKSSGVSPPGSVVMEFDPKETFVRTNEWDGASGVFLEISAEPLEEIGGKPVGWLIRFQDRTRAQKEMENELSSLRGSLVASFTTGFAHELNNPLTVLSGLIQSIKSYPEDFTLSECREIMEPAVREASSIVQKLISFAEKADGRVVGSVLVEEVVDLCERFFTRSADTSGSPSSLSLEFPGIRRIGDLKKLVRCNEYDFLEIITEVVKNAAEAQREVHNEDPIEISAEYRGDHTVVTVDDRGPGVPEGFLKRVYDPFFTTKPSFGKKGLGLATALFLCRRYGGSLILKNKEGGGARAVISLPKGEDIPDVSNEDVEDRCRRQGVKEDKDDCADDSVNRGGKREESDAGTADEGWDCWWDS